MQCKRVFSRCSKTWRLTNGRVLSKNAKKIPGWRLHISGLRCDCLQPLNLTRGFFFGFSGFHSHRKPAYERTFYMKEVFIRKWHIKNELLKGFSTDARSKILSYQALQELSLHSNPHFEYMGNSCNIIIYLHIYGLIVDPHNNLLPVGLIAQQLEHCTGIAEVRVPIPVQA